ncbi:hypothetical protein L6452_09379 [Arctium lappa]|uniref:Uncharacterized protein n=1 Tax=Arctium lappa TaxID=4217 RepID=A0ACB9DKW9_ARCLA|nr:hypothetical protein L6452_09379 [Arctium lappa]
MFTRRRSPTPYRSVVVHSPSICPTLVRCEIAGEDEVADQPISSLCFDLSSLTLRLDGGDLGFYLQRRFQSDLGFDLFFVEKMSNSKNKVIKN